MIRSLQLLVLFNVFFWFQSPARADGYFGGEIGYGMASGEVSSLDSGFVLGMTAGYQLDSSFAIGITYQHSALNFTGTDTGVSVSQLLAEANVFSLLLLHGGVHIGDVVTNYGGASSSDLGLGFHVGFDIHVSMDTTVGLGMYWTYVTEANDKHSLINFVVPVKYWF